MKNLVLVGGAGGIGRSLANRAFDEGWEVTVMDLETSITKHPPKKGIETRNIDLSDHLSISKAFKGFKSLSGLVNLAGFMHGLNSLEDTTNEEFDELISICRFSMAN